MTVEGIFSIPQEVYQAKPGMALLAALLITLLKQFQTLQRSDLSLLFSKAILEGLCLCNGNGQKLDFAINNVLNVRFRKYVCNT